MDNLPYIPYAAYSTGNASDNLIYLLQPPSSARAKGQLIVLNITGISTTSNITSTTITDGLPFLTDVETFTSVTDGNGNITVFAGDCQAGKASTSLWRFMPGNNGVMGGVWEQEQSTGLVSSTGKDGTPWLAAGMTFSTVLNSNPDLYLFGGMCPNSTDLTEDTWQESANYTNNLILAQSSSPSGQSSASATSYELSLVSSRGPPIPEAGLTITPLQPTFFNSSGGEITQQQNFVFLGGHTQTAFINMSQIALFSLPQQSWSFLPVDNPTTTSSNTDLTRRSSTNVDPRSGHSALLMDDGQHVVIYGGWVGDVNTPADPQLAILKVGAGYGGSGDWEWSIPSTQGTAPSTIGGIYGHAAAMLPGDVMMIVGGYTITDESSSSQSPERKSKRSDSANGFDTYFYNVTSSSWITTYTNPSYVAGGQSGSSNTSGGGLNTAEQAGLGAGLAFGLAAIIAAIAFYFWYSRRMRRRREAREKELHDLAMGAQNFNSSALGLGGIDGRGGEKSAMEWMGGQRTNNSDPWSSNPVSVGNQRGVNATEAERTGLLVEIPSPTRGLRRSLHSRASYQPPSWYDDGRRSTGAGNIHPIDEREEFDEDLIEVAPTAEPTKPKTAFTYQPLPNPAAMDPFRDPIPLGSHPPVAKSRSPSPTSPARERELEAQGWNHDWNAAEALMLGQPQVSHHAGPSSDGGRVSPDKTDRTSSTLSDRSAYSTVSNFSIQHSISSLSRSVSQRSAFLFNFSNPPAGVTTNTGNTSQITVIDHSRSPVSPFSTRAPSLTIDTTAAASRPPIDLTADSFRTAQTSFQQLQSEASGLLYGGRDGSNSGSNPSTGSSHLNTPNPYLGGGGMANTTIIATTMIGGTQGDSSTAASRALGFRARNWMGSLRRTLLAASTERSNSTSPDTTASSPIRSSAPAGEQGDGPRRAASAGATLWRKRQGARDWDVEGGSAGGSGERRGSWVGGNHRGNRDSGTTTSGGSHGGDGLDGAIGNEEDGGEWDVEGAVERRLVQVMFTVPRERLRVVNGDAASVRSLSVRSGEVGPYADGMGGGGGISGRRERDEEGG
ncbi:hypothetical protein MMC25_002070 [Agyrium rufum]|nr:hypothetical protein [Agyrium rufum]